MQGALERIVTVLGDGFIDRTDYPALTDVAKFAGSPQLVQLHARKACSALRLTSESALARIHSRRETGMFKQPDQGENGSKRTPRVFKDKTTACHDRWCIHTVRVAQQPNYEPTLRRKGMVWCGSAVSTRDDDHTYSNCPLRDDGRSTFQARPLDLSTSRPKYSLSLPKKMDKNRNRKSVCTTAPGRARLGLKFHWTISMGDSASGDCFFGVLDALLSLVTPVGPLFLCIDRWMSWCS
ncbi:hypothetical protein BS17DRAFT_785140 [Gyrodon lividus]|nr:hypothetical protein BS17DRAFT_785140 [Gyrodon lividus]